MMNYILVEIGRMLSILEDRLAIVNGWGMFVRQLTDAEIECLIAWRQQHCSLMRRDSRYDEVIKSITVLDREVQSLFYACK